MSRLPTGTLLRPPTGHWGTKKVEHVPSEQVMQEDKRTASEQSGGVRWNAAKNWMKSSQKQLLLLGPWAASECQRHLLGHLCGWMESRLNGGTGSEALVAHSPRVKRTSRGGAGIWWSTRRCGNSATRNTYRSYRSGCLSPHSVLCSLPRASPFCFASLQVGHWLIGLAICSANSVSAQSIYVLFAGAIKSFGLVEETFGKEAVRCPLRMSWLHQKLGDGRKRARC